MPKADPFQQRRLLDVAAVDRGLSTVRHRRTNLPELAELSAAAAGAAELRSARALAQVEVDDLERDGSKLDAEIETVRLRAKRDAERLEAGTGGAAALQGLSHEIESLARRQGVLEDAALELMERRETADSALAELQSKESEIEVVIADAEQRRDTALAALDAERDRLTADRSAALSGLPADLVALYERIHASGKVAAGELAGANCGACRMDIDRSELTSVRAAAPDEIVRCPECGAILVRH